MRKLLLPVAFIFLALSAISQDKILGVLGSSTAVGTGANPLDSSWVRRVNEYYKRTTSVIDTTYNLAVGGQNPYHGMPSSYTQPAGRPGPDHDNNITYLSTFNPDVIIVNYPSNNYDTYTFAEIKTTLTTIKDSANKAGIVCFITTTQPRTSFSAANRQKLKDIKDSIIKWFGNFAINFYDPLVNESDLSIHPDYRVTGDDIHVNNAGHRKLYEQVLAKDIFSAVLAVRLGNFSGRQVSNAIQLSWKAFTEESFTRYFIERSYDGRGFEAVGNLPAKGASEAMYTFTYKDNFNGKIYFRIRVEENERKFYSPIISVLNSNAVAAFRVYQVSAKQIAAEVFEPTATTARLEIYTATGQLALRYQEAVGAGNTTLLIDCSQLNKGVYFVKQSGKTNKTLRFILK